MPGYSQNKGETEFLRMVAALLVSALFFFSLPASGACRDFSVAGKTITPGTMQGIELSGVLGKLLL